MGTSEREKGCISFSVVDSTATSRVSSISFGGLDPLDKKPFSYLSLYLSLRKKVELYINFLLYFCCKNYHLGIKISSLKFEYIVEVVSSSLQVP